MAKALMFMGTGSDVGKSLLVAGLCRALSNRGHTVVPFKPQNMSNNAAVTADGGEIGRAQALQARAARQQPVTAMNPVLLKPEGDGGSQVVIRGQRRATMPARQYWAERAQWMPEVLAAFGELGAGADIVLVEGAGSASEINLRGNDLANFGFARAAGVPVVLVADIERGGVIAAVVGTFAVVDAHDRALVKASLINKFRGDPALFEAGKSAIATHTGVPCLGPVPWFAAAGKLPAEDSLALGSMAQKDSGLLTIAVPLLPRIANFDDLDPLRGEPNVRVVMVKPGDPLPRDSDWILLPGSKATRSDLAALKDVGWDIDIHAHHRAGGGVLGICGGYQMLGRTVADPQGIEGEPGVSEGLGLLEVETVLEPRKELRVEAAVHAGSGAAIRGYHMHMGVTGGRDRARPFAHVGTEGEGAVSADGRVMGTYLHGLFAADGFRRAWLGNAAAADFAYEAEVEATLDALADHLERHLDVDQLLAMAAEV